MPQRRLPGGGALIPQKIEKLVCPDGSADNAPELVAFQPVLGRLKWILPIESRVATEPDPWQFGFAVIHKIDNVLIGMAGFPGPPSDGVAEIAYGIAPSYQGKGFATEVAKALFEFASRDSRVRTICAHTLPEMNASTRVLEKCGFRKTGEMLDSENALVWRWEKNPAKIDIKQLTK